MLAAAVAIATLVHIYNKRDKSGVQFLIGNPSQSYGAPPAI